MRSKAMFYQHPLFFSSSSSSSAFMPPLGCMIRIYFTILTIERSKYCLHKHNEKDNKRMKGKKLFKTRHYVELNKKGGREIESESEATERRKK